MRKIRNVDKTWAVVRAISSSDYNLYFFIELDTESQTDFSNYTKVYRLDDLKLSEIDRLLNRKNTMFIYVEEGDEE